MARHRAPKFVIQFDLIRTGIVGSIFVAVAVVVLDSRRDLGGAQIQAEDAVFVDVCVGESDGRGQVDAVAFCQPVAVDLF